MAQLFGADQQVVMVASPRKASLCTFNLNFLKNVKLKLKSPNSPNNSWFIRFFKAIIIISISIIS